MNKIIFLMAATIIFVAGCSAGNQPSSAYHSDTEMVEGLVNNSLIDRDVLSDYVGNTKSEDAVMFDMILEYNESNDKTVFSGNKGNQIKNLELKKRLFMLADNL